MKNVQDIVCEPSRKVLLRAKEIICDGGLVAFPTETVYGLGASVFNENAVKNIFDVKGRPGDNPLIVHVHSIEQIKDLTVEITPIAKTLIKKFMPGAITIVLKKAKCVPDIVTAGLDSVAIRMPSHKVAREFLSVVNIPIPAPSANTSTRPSPTTAMHVYEDLGNHIPLIIDGGACSVGIESTVVDCTGEVPIILRPGYITEQDIKQAVGCVAVYDGSKSNKIVPSPGVKYKHYAPSCEMFMVETEVEENLKRLYMAYKSQNKRVIILCYSDTKKMLEGLETCLIGEDDKQAMANFYAILRELEKKYDVIIAEAPKKNGLGTSLYNRMIKSCAGKVI